MQKWTAAQNREARSALDKIPERKWIEDRFARLLNTPSTNYVSLTSRKGTLFMLKFQPPAQQPFLVTLSSVTNLATERVVLDVNRIDANGTTAIDWFVPSPDGKLIAVSLSEKGSEMGTLYFYEVATAGSCPMWFRVCKDRPPVAARRGLAMVGESSTRAIRIPANGRRRS